MCPLLSVDAFRHLAGFGSMGGAYRRLETLRRAGLAHVERMELGYLVADRPLGLWSVTGKGLRLLHVACADQNLQRSGGSGRRMGRRRTNLTLRVAAYRLLAFVAAEVNADMHTVDLRSCEQPWVRSACDDHGGRLRVELPSGAVLGRRLAEPDRAAVSGERIKVILIPDLCTVPVEHYRQRLCRLFLYGQVSGDHEWQVLVATGDRDPGGARVRAWMLLLEEVGRGLDSTANDCRVVSWEHVQSVLADAVQLRPTRRDLRPGAERGRTSRAEYAPQRLGEQVLHLAGRHPCLSVHQLAQLLGTTTVRIRRVEDELMDSGWLRRIDLADIPANAIDLGHNDVVTLGLVEITPVGRRQLAAWLGLDATTAARYHGLIGTGRSDAGRRRRFLRTLAHTLGSNSVFVALAVASAAVRRAGGSDRLSEWRGAAACERKHCKPDGYGCYVRDGQAHGFFLEYDRGTESTRAYAAKFRAYYSYRDSRQAQRDYNGFPTLLFVTTQPRAEQRIADAASRAWFIRCTEPLAVLITTTSRITSDREGILGRIWRRPGPIGATADDEHQYWLTDGRSESLVGGPPPFKNSAESPGLSRDEFRQHQRSATDGEVASQ